MEGFLKKSVARKFESEIKTGAFAEISEQLLSAANVSPKFSLAERDPDAFRESRERLRTEAGLVIANHPGKFDSYIILSQIDRDDIKIVVSEGNYRQVTEMFGSVPIIKATSERTEGRQFLAEIADHVTSGGLVLLYPTGGGDHITHGTSAPLEFQRGLGMVLKYSLRPTDMMYSFYVEPAEVRKAAADSPSRITAATSSITVPLLAGLVSPKSTAVITTHERYATVAEWQACVDGAIGQEREHRLTQYFLGQFPYRY